jgi:hypothetical protein
MRTDSASKYFTTKPRDCELPLGTTWLRLFSYLCERESKLPMPASLLPWCKQPADIRDCLIDLIEHPASLLEDDRQVDDYGHCWLT